MAIYLTGDVHRKMLRIFELRNRLTEGDKLIVLGDFGLNWYGADDIRDRTLIYALSTLPFEILFIDGNHENFDALNTFPNEERYGGYVKKLAHNIFYLMRGGIYEIENRTFFTLGGGSSIDKADRISRVTWWEEELPTSFEVYRAYKNLESREFKVDYILTHSPSYKVLEAIQDRHIIYEEMTQARYKLEKADNLNHFLDRLDEKLSYRQWYFGHVHLDYDEVLKKKTALYERVIKLN